MQLFVLSVTLAFALADELETDLQQVEDLQASASVAFQRSQEYNLPVADRFSYVSSTVSPRRWNPDTYSYDNPIKPVVSLLSQDKYQSRNYYQPESSYNNQYDNQNSWNAPQPSKPTNSWGQNNPEKGWNNQQNTWTNQQSTAQNSWNNQQNTAQNSWNNQQGTAQNSWNNQQSTSQNSWNNQQSSTQNTWNNQQSGSQNTGAQNNWNQKPQNSWNNQQNAGSQNNWNSGNQNQNTQSSSSTTTPTSVIKNEQTLGDDGSYKYE